MKLLLAKMNRLFSPKQTWCTWLHAQVLIIFFPIMVSAQQQATLTTRLDGAQLVVGDQARLFLELQQPAGTRIDWAKIPDTFNSLEVVERGRIDTLSQNGLTVYKQRLLITGFDSGAFTIPSFQFTATPDAGQPYTLQSDSFQLGITTVAVDTTKPFRPIKDIVAVPASWLDYLPYILLGAVLAGVIIGIIIYLKKRKKPEPKPAFIPGETLQQRTLRLLRELDEQQIWQRGQVKEYYVALTDILRQYLEARFKIMAMEQTTDELLEQANRHTVLVRHREQLSQILRTADLAKFAKAQPLPAEHVQAMELTQSFVIQTPQPEEPKPNSTQP